MGFLMAAAFFGMLIAGQNDYSNCKKQGFKEAHCKWAKDMCINFDAKCKGHK